MEYTTNAISDREIEEIVKDIELLTWKRDMTDEERYEENWQHFWTNTTRQKFMTNRQPVPRIL